MIGDLRTYNIIKRNHVVMNNLKDSTESSMVVIDCRFCYTFENVLQLQYSYNL